MTPWQQPKCDVFGLLRRRAWTLLMSFKHNDNSCLQVMCSFSCKTRWDRVKSFCLIGLWGVTAQAYSQYNTKLLHQAKWLVRQFNFLSTY